MADLAAVLSGAEIAQLLFTLTSIDTQLQLPAAALPGFCLVGVGMVVAATMFRWMAVVVTLAGVLAALVDTALKDGPVVAAVLVSTTVVLWMITRLSVWWRPGERGGVSHPGALSTVQSTVTAVRTGS